MSYMRWSSGDWYAFWNTSSGTTKEEQVLSLWYVGGDNETDWTYQTLDGVGVGFVFDKYKEHELSRTNAFAALGLIYTFLRDVDIEFNEEKTNDQKTDTRRD